ncbi:PARP catalytic domain-containing protein [Entamoeba marina]
MASAQVENDFFTFCERNEDVFLVDHFPEKYAMKLSLARYDEEFLLIYDSNYPQSKFKVNLKGPHNEHTMKRANSIWELQPVIGINDALVQFLIIDKEERAYLKQLKEDPEQQKKRMREKFREQYNKIMANEKETQLNFNTQLSFQILTDDIIQVHLNKEKYGFDITAVNNNPFHWIVSFFNFNPTSAIFKDVQHLESLSSLDCVQMEFKFSVAMFPVFPPEYNFFAPKLTVQSLKDIFNSGAFEEECYNPFTKITLFKMIHNLIEKKGHIDFGKNGKQVLDYTNTDFFNEMQGCKPFLGRITHLGQEFIKNCKINGMPTKKFNSIQFIYN